MVPSSTEIWVVREDLIDKEVLINPHSSRRLDRSNGSGGSHLESNSKEKKKGLSETAFLPSYSQQQQPITYNAVEDYILQQIQESYYKFALDIVKAPTDVDCDNPHIGSRPLIRTMESMKEILVDESLCWSKPNLGLHTYDAWL